MPAPLYWDSAHGDSAFPLELEGIHPHLEQNKCEFTIGGEDFYAMMLEQEDAGAYKYAGVGVGDLGHLKGHTKTTVKTLWTGNTVGGESTTVPLKDESWNLSVTNVTKVWADSSRRKCKLTISVSKSNYYSAVAVPLLQPMRSPGKWPTYVAAGNWGDFGGKTETALYVQCKPGDTYAVFVAKQVPSSVAVLSSVKRVKLT